MLENQKVLAQVTIILKTLKLLPENKNFKLKNSGTEKQLKEPGIKQNRKWKI